MRVILWLGLVLGLLWGGYWVVGSSAITRGTEQWIKDAAAQGMIVENSGISVSGFPSRFDLTITKPRLSDPASGWSWKAPFAQLLSMTWKPWHVIAILPNDQEIDAPQQRIALTSSKMAASLRLRPTSDLTLEELVVEGHDLTIQSDLGWQIGAKSGVLALAGESARPFGQHLGLEIVDLRPDPVLARQLPSLGDVVSAIHLDASIVLSTALDRHIGETEPVVTDLIVHDFRVTWGTLQLTAKGQVGSGPDGRAQGQIDFRVKDWQQIPAFVVALGLVRPEMGKSLISGLDVLAKSGADPKVLDLALTFADGWANLGPLPLGPAPMLN